MQQRVRHFVKQALIWQSALAFYWLALFIATHVPSEVGALPGASMDKLVHVIAFALLAMLLATAWQLTAGPLGWRHLAWAWILLVLYGAIDEWTQTFVGREASILDLGADALGAIIGLALFVVLRSSFDRRGQRADPH